jgi:hypothetical protein
MWNNYNQATQSKTSKIYSLTKILFQTIKNNADTNIEITVSRQK